LAYLLLLFIMIQFTNIRNDFLFGIAVVPKPIRWPIMAGLDNLSTSFRGDISFRVCFRARQ
jgi:hypothetical protein